MGEGRGRKKRVGDGGRGGEEGWGGGLRRWGEDGARKRAKRRGGGERSFKGWEWSQNGGTARAVNFATCNKLLLLVTDRANVQRF